MTAKPNGRRALGIGVLLLAIVAAMVFSNFRRDLHAAQQRLAHASRIVMTACGPIEYAVAGDGPPVLIVHGAGGGFDQGLAFAEPLVARGFFVIAMSRFGYLRTPLPADASAAAQADAHACLLDALGVPRSAVIGASAGAPSSMQLALRHPKRVGALVLLVPAAYVPRPENAPPMHTPPGVPFFFETALESDFLLWAATRVAPRALIASLLATPLDVVDQASARERERLQRELDRILPVSRRRAGLLNDAKVIATLARYEVERITAPTLVVSVEDDRYGTYAAARYTAEHIKGARFVGYAAGGHLWVGHQEELVSEIARFLQRPTDRRTGAR